MFKSLNRWFMVPLTRAGLGAWVSSPVGGYMVLLRVRGRRTGLVRETPVNYVVRDGSAWVLAGFGERTEWYRNLLADPMVEMVLPARPPIPAVADVVWDPAIRSVLVPEILRSTIGPTLGAGMNPWRTPDQAVADDMGWVPLVRLTPVGLTLEPGPDDPGGTAWIWRQVLVVLVTLGAVRVLRRALRRRVQGQ
jgi:deazaflavin-dependent oxidoreductase (nitroreductase family)